ncbi:hypothetical protein ACVGVM_20815 [Pseudonocardia bannensis]|uniref:Transposase n=1 Tax=Pseudonocardia bannensis TaxID=630973 RepID=A0A848DSP2_9PSEU|nr:transposase [Pseudonocardia bannensis]NMH95426.1 transposase [Pseudonocardia bannensis]
MRDSALGCGDHGGASSRYGALIRERRVVAVIPEPFDQQGHRTRRGSRGGGPPAFDSADYRNRNVVERGFCHIRQWRGLATRYDNSR